MNDMTNTPNAQDVARVEAALQTKKRGAKPRNVRPAPDSSAKVLSPEKALVLANAAVKARDTEIEALKARCDFLEQSHKYDKEQPYAEAKRLYDLHLDTEAKYRPLMSAIMSLAAYFHEDGQVWSEEARSFVSANVLAKQQQFFLRDFCYKLTDKLHYAMEQHAKAADTWRRVLRETTEDEIGLQERARVIAWGTRVRDERDRVLELLQIAEVAYHHITGEAFVRQKPREVKRPPAPRGQTQLTAADLQRQAEQAGFGKAAPSPSRPYAPQHNGIDPAQ